MSEIRVQLWAAKNGKGVTSSPKLCTLPPTTESFLENVKRAHYQAIIWRSLEKNDPPELEPEEFGWKKEPETKTLTPVALPEKCPMITKLCPQHDEMWLFWRSAMFQEV